MPAVVTSKTRLFAVKNFIEAFSERSPDIGYLAIGRSTAWTDELDPPSPDSSVEDEVEFFQNLLAMKKISSSSVKQVIKRFNWESGSIYDPYDNQTGEIVGLTNPFYVLTDEGKLYKCIDRPASTASTVKPTGESLGFTTTGDGYIWKYMLSLSVSDVQNFLTNDWIPVEYLSIDDGSAQWDVQQAAVDGGVHRVVVEAGGSGYTTATVNVVSGDGIDFAATANIGIGGDIESITVTNPGTGYREIELSITGDGTDASIRGIISPRGGHGSNVLEELNAIYAMVRTELAEGESGDFPTNVSFRQLGIILNPLTTDTTGVQLDLTTSNGDFSPGDTITGGSSGATGTVVTWDYVLRRLVLSDVTGVFTTESISNGSGITGTISTVTPGVNIPATELTYPAAEIEPEKGDLIYLENRLSIQRNDSQTEDIRLVIEF